MSKKTFTIALAALMILVLSLCVFAACDKDKQKDPVPPGPEGGTYYFDAGANGEYTLDIVADSQFTLTMAGTTRNGWYDIAGSALTLHFNDGDKETISAQLTNNYSNLAFAYNGQNYVFLRKANYTVTFVTGEGATTVDPVTVLNGKCIDKPASPTKTGSFVFEGWYLTDKFESKFDFDSPVTSDLTLYANFVSSIREPIEFTVKFAGAGAQNLQPVETIKGVAYELPELKKDGDKFIGWWVSDANVATKLSYEYDGQKLDENTTLFAVWQSELTAGLQVSATPTGVYWSGASNVTITIVNPDNVTTTLNGQKNEYLFGSNTYNPSKNGEYKVTVAPAGSSEATTRYFVKGMLPRVSCFEVEGNSVKFNHVEGATSYNVSVKAKDGAQTGVVSADTAQNNTLLFDFSQYDIPADGYEFTVEAVGRGYLSSTSDTFNYNRFLNKVAAPVFDEATQSFSWQAVEHADRYVVKLNGEQVADSPAASFDLKFKDPGAYTIEVQPFAFGYNTTEATTATVNKQKLAAPSNLTASADGNHIVWDHVNGNAGYIVFKDDTVLEETATESYLFDVNLIANGAVNIYVVTKSSNPSLNSPKSNAMNVSNRVETITYDKGLISWSFVLGKSKYFVKINDGDELEVNGTSTDALSLVAKTNVITVRPDGGEPNSTTVEAFEITFDLGYQGVSHPSQFKTTGESLHITNPAAERYGYDFEYWMDENGTQITDGTFNGTADTVYSAKWNPHEFLITFDLTDQASDEEKNDAKYNNQTVTFDDGNFTLPAPSTVSKDGKHAFEGWYMSLGGSTGAQKVTDYQGKAVAPFAYNPSDGKVTFFAQWVEIFKFEAVEGGWRVQKNGNYIDYLSNVKIPAKQEDQWVVAISDFSNCTKLVTLDIPSSVSQINFGEQGVSFAGDTALMAINVYPAEGYTGTVKYSSNDGMLLENDAQGNAVKLMYCPLGKLSRLTELNIPAGVKTVAAGAFYSSNFQYNQFHVTTINFPISVERVEANAFYNIRGVETINFLAAQEGETAADVLVIEAGAFTGDGDAAHSTTYDVTTINLPARFEATNFDLFDEFRWLEQINVIEEGGKFTSVGGVLCLKSGATLELAKYPLFGASDYSIPTEITKIGAKAFYHNTRIKNVTIGGHVTNIGESAFEGCMGMTTLTFLGTKESGDLHIARKAFYGYNKSNTSSSVLWPQVTELTLPANLVELGEMAFGNHGRLHEVHVDVDRDSVNFADNAFVDSENNKVAWVTDVYLGAGVPEFAIAAVFGGSLKRVVVDPQNEFYTNDENDGTNNGALYNKAMTQLVFFPKAFEGTFSIPTTITEITGSLFSGCNLMVGIKIHNKVTSIGDFAFDDCAKLVDVIFCDQEGEPLTEEGKFDSLVIGVNAFKDCVSLLAINLPEGLTTLDEGVFSGCTKLNTVHLPSTLETMALKSADSAEEGEVGDFTMFEKCYSLATLTVAEGNEKYGAKDDVLYSLRKVNTAAAEEEAVYDFVEDTLLFCSRGKDGVVRIPSTVRRVQNNAFSGCIVSEIIFEDLEKTNDVGAEDMVDLVIMAGALYNTPMLERLVLPEGMTSLADTVVDTVHKNMFSKMNVLESAMYEESFKAIEFPSTLKTIGARVFDGNFRWYDPLTVKFAEAAEGQDVEGLTIEDAPAEKSSSTATSTSATNKGLFVQYTSGSYGSTTSGINIAPITFPAHLVYLGKATLYYTKVSSVTFTEPAKKEDGSYKYQLQIGANAFYDASNLTSLTLPANLTSIGDHAFFKPAFASVTIPAAVKTIDANAFAGSSTGNASSQSMHLATLQFAADSTLETIGNSAFASQSLSSVTIPASVKEIGNLALSVNKQLSSVTFEDFDKVKEPAKSDETADGEATDGESDQPFEIDDILLTIGDNAFAADTALKEITLPARLKSLGANAFLNSGLQTITFAGGDESEEIDETPAPDYATDRTVSHLESIGDMAFSATPITSIKFPKTISSGTTNELKLGSNLFVGCTQLTEVTLSSTVLDLSNVFAGCGTIQKINVNVNNPKFAEDENGLPIIYEKSGQSDEMSVALVYADITGTVTLSGTKIGAGALANITGVQHVLIGPSVTEIGDRAFENCVSLETVQILSGSQLLTVGSYAFQNCTSLTEVDFSNASKLTTFGDGVSKATTSITGASSLAGYIAQTVGIFNGCSNLDTVKLGSGVTKLGIAMFAGSGVKTVDLSLSTNLEEFAEAAFGNTPRLTTIIFPAAKDNKIAHLGKYTFFGSGVKELDFSSCQLLKATAPTKYLATNPDGTDPDSKKALNDTSQYAATFEYATNLQKVTFPTSLTALGQYTFLGCSSLTTVLNTANLNKLCKYCFSATGDVQLTFGDVDVTIGQYAFNNAGNVQITPPANHIMTFEDTYTFAGSKIQTWTIRTQDVYTKPNYMFNNCSALTNVYVSVAAGKDDNFTTIGDYMFQGCTSLVSFEFDKLTNLNAIGDYAFNMYNSSTKEANENAFIGQLVDGKSVVDLSKTQITTIDPQAFSCCYNLNTVKLPSTLTKLGSGSENVSNFYTGVFYGCTGLEKVDFSLCSNLTVLGKNAFYGCTSLDNVDMTTTQLDKLYNNTFRGCTSLANIKLPDSLTRFDGTYQFQGCTSLEHIDLSNTSISTLPYASSFALTTTAYTFADCTNLQSVTLSNAVTGIGTYAFQNCGRLESIHVVDDNGRDTDSAISIVANYAFQNCAALADFDFSAITKIGTFAFAGTGFTAITLPDKSFAASSISASAFEGCEKLLKVVIPSKFSVANNVANYMFRYCTSLTTVEFTEVEGAANRTLPKGMFAGCTQLAAIDFTNAYTTSVPAEFLSGAIMLGEVTLPETLTTIGANAFENCSGLSAASFGEDGLTKVTKIEAAAFKNCAFTEVTFEALTSLANDSFAGNNLTSVTLNGNAANSFAFNDTFKSLTNKDGTTTYTYNPTLSENGTLDLSAVEDLVLSAYMFQNVAGLKNVILPALKAHGSELFPSIPANTFANSSVETVDLSNTGIVYIYQGAFQNSQLKEISIPRTVLMIDKFAFANTQLETLTIPSNVQMINEAAFANCSKLKTVKIDDGEDTLTIKNATNNGTALTKNDYPKAGEATKLGVFENDPITKFTAGNRVTTIPRNAFAITAEYPDVQSGAEFDLTYVTRIEDYAFFGSLAGTVVLGEGLTYIGAAAFAKTTLLSTVTFNNADGDEVEFKRNGNEATTSASETGTTVYYFGVFEGSAVASVVGAPKFVNTSTEEAEIGVRMFADCVNLAEIDLNDMPTIGNYAFKNAALTAVSLAGITTVGTCAFYNNNMTTLTIPSCVMTIGSGAFAYTPLTEVTFEDGDEPITLTKGSTSSVSVDAETGEYKLDNAHTNSNCGVFDSCLQLSSVTFGNRVKSITGSTFFHCASLTTITLPDGVEICGSAFAFTGLTTINNLENVTEIKDSSVFQRIKITSLTLDIGVNVSANNVFTDCDDLTTVTFTNKNNVTTTQSFNQMFKKCDNLTSVTFCEGITQLSMTFVDCVNLPSVVLPESLTTLGGNVFQNCTGLKKVVMPRLLTTFNDATSTSPTFNGCGKDLHIYFQTERAVAYALTYKITKNNDGVITGTSAPLVSLEEQCTVHYGYDPTSEEDTSSADATALMQTALGTVADDKQ